VRAIVARLFEQALERLAQAPQLTLPLTQDHPLIRPAAEYGELFRLGAGNGSRPFKNSNDDPSANRARVVSAIPASSDDASAPARTPALNADQTLPLNPARR
jgi:hypothetical protein